MHFFNKDMRIFQVIFLTILLVACGEKNPLDVDVSGIEVEIRIDRMEKELFECKYEDLPALNTRFSQKYGDLWDAYVAVMLRAGSPDDSLIVVSLDRFIHDEVMMQVYQDISAEYGDLSWLQKDLEEAFRHLKYYYPDAEIPLIVTYNSVFNYGVSTFEHSVGVGLDMYLGPDNRTVKKISTEMIPQFMKDKMIREYLVVDIMRGWFEVNFMEELQGQDFLSRIVYEGKILYALDALLPTTPDHIKIRYTSDQFGWCIENENNIWRDIVDKKLLYSTEPLEIKKFCDEAPFTSGLPNNSPGRVGTWLGWMMVRAYVKEHPETTLPQLMAIDNPKKILKSYKPEKK